VDVHEELNQILEISKAVLEKRIDPFKVNVKELLERLDQLFSKLNTIEDYLKDAEAIHGIAAVLKEQTLELNFRTSNFYAPPEVLLEKIKKLDLLSLANLLALNIYPIMSTSYLTYETLVNALEYWQTMKKIRFERKEGMSSFLKIKLEELGLKEKNTIEKVEKLKDELSKIVPVKLREILKNKSYEERIEILYLLSYLITKGIFFLEEKEDDLIVTDQKSPFKGTIIIEATKWAKE